jgi:hypothetical protein
MKKTFSNKSILICIIILIFVLFYFIWFNNLESWTEKVKVDYPGNDILKEGKEIIKTSAFDCASECRKINGCKGIVTNFRFFNFGNKQRDANDPPRCWLKNAMNGNGQTNTENRFTYIL